MASTQARPPTRREAQLAATREAVLEAADRLFRERGYTATTISAVAREAGSAVQTVYNAVGGKGALLSAVLDRTASGPEGRPVVAFLAERLDAAPDGAAVVRVVADWFAEVNPRTMPAHRAMTEGAAIDPEIAVLRADRAMQRLERYRRTARLLEQHGNLRPGLDADDVGATVWSIGSPATYEALVLQAGWTVDAYRAWVEATLTAALLA